MREGTMCGGRCAEASLSGRASRRRRLRPSVVTTEGFVTAAARPFRAPRPSGEQAARAAAGPRMVASRGPEHWAAAATRLRGRLGGDDHVLAAAA
jgi:hypothetical protein